MLELDTSNTGQLKFNIPGDVTRKIGLILKKFIVQRTLKGIDKDGQAFRPYSTKTFALPAGAVTKRARKILEKDGLLHYFKRGATVWMTVTGGYVTLKKAIYAQTQYDGTVNLTQTGQMLRSLTVLDASDNTVTLGFTRAEDAMKAYWNAEKGRHFLGVLPSELNSPEIANLFLDNIIIKT